MRHAKKTGNVQMHRLGSVAIVALAVVVLGGACYPDTETTFCANTGRRCPPGFVCSGDGNSCLADECGNGIVSINEACDDGNTIDGDDCDSNCTPTGCGNGIRTGIEECDDGNSDNNDDCLVGCIPAQCGDNYLWQEREECDDGNTVTEACPYDDRSCTICNQTCQRVGGVSAACGDRIVQVPESCDIGMVTCGTCIACAVFAPAKAVGKIEVKMFPVPENSEFTLTDGYGTTVVFTFIQGATQGDQDHIYVTKGMLTRIVNYTPEDMAEVRNAVAEAIDEARLFLLLQIDANANPTDDSLVNLTHQRASALGNVPIPSNASPSVLAITGMDGGVGRNCDANVFCRSDADCKSDRCRGNPKRCE